MTRDVTCSGFRAGALGLCGPSSCSGTLASRPSTQRRNDTVERVAGGVSATVDVSTAARAASSSLSGSAGNVGVWLSIADWTVVGSTAMSSRSSTR